MGPVNLSKDFFSEEGEQTSVMLYQDYLYLNFKESRMFKNFYWGNMPFKKKKNRLFAVSFL